MSDRFDVLGIGNAIVDILARTQDGFIAARGLTKGEMRLVTTEESEALYAAMGPAVEVSGGAAANTIAGIASFGSSGAYFGVVRDDQLGKVFRHDITALGVHFNTPARTSGEPTARSMILITPDGERTMNTYLGACVSLGPDDIDEDVVRGAGVTYMEGYLFDPPLAKQAFYKAAKIAHAAGNKVSLTLSDSFCVERYRDEFLHFVRNEVDILFANEAEILSLYQTQDFDTARDAARHDVPIAALTRSEKGSVIVAGKETHQVPAQRIEQVVDATGAGDLYAAGFLHGHARGLPLDQCAALGGMAAAEIISQVGARPQRSLRQMAIEKGILAPA